MDFQQRVKHRHREEIVPSALIISGGGSPGALDMVRCLHKAGIPSWVMSSQERDIARYSRGCVGRSRLPEFTSAHYPRILEILVRHGMRSSDRPVLFYASDPELNFVWTFRKELSRYYRFLLPPEEIFECLLNKVMFAQFAGRYRLPVPPSIICRDVDDVRKRINEIPFPCIVKPAMSEHWSWKTAALREKFGPYKSALRRFTSADELVDFCKDLPFERNGFMIQRYVDGGDDAIYSFHGYLDESSNCLASFIGCKIRTYPMHTGGSTYIRTLHHPYLTEASIKLLRKMNYRGIVKIDFKYDTQTDEFYILEINTRYNLWQLLGTYAGRNLAAVAYYHQTGGRYVLPQTIRNGYRLLYFKQDLRSFITGYRKTGEWSVAAYMKSLLGMKCFRVWDWTDPLPFVVSASGFVLRNAARLLRRILPARGDQSMVAMDAAGSKPMEMVQPSRVEP